MRFSLDVPIHQVILEIKEKVGHELNDHGLFQPPAPATKTKGRWLQENRGLRHYTLPQDCELEFRKKHRILHYELIDGSQKTVLIDDTEKVAWIRDAVGEKLGLGDAAEYGLRVKGGKEGIWLNPQAGLWEQDVTPEMTLIFDKNYFLTDELIDLSDPVQLHLIYSKAVASIVTGKYPVTMQEAVKLASLQAQAVHNNFSPTTSSGYLKIQDFVPKQWLFHKRIKPKQIEAMIYNEWRTLVGTDPANAKYKYVQAVRQLPTYGITFYTVKIPNPKKNMQKKIPVIPLVVGITHHKILKMDFETKQVLHEYPLIHLKRWAAVRGKFTFDFGDHADSYWTVLTDEGEAMSNLIAGYIDLLLRSQRGPMGNLDDDQGGDKADEEDFVPDASGTGFVAAGTSSHLPQSAGQLVRGQQMAQGGGMGGGGMGPGGGGGNGGYGGGNGGVVTDPDHVHDLLSAASCLTQMKNNFNVLKGDGYTGSPAGNMEILRNKERATDAIVSDLVDALTDVSPDAAKIDSVAIELVKRAKDFSLIAGTVAGTPDQNPQLPMASVGVLSSLVDLIDGANKYRRDTTSPFFSEAHKNYQDAMLLMQGVQSDHINDDATVELVESALRNVGVAVSELVNVSYQHMPDASTPALQNLMNNYTKQLTGGQKHLESSAKTLAPTLIDEVCRAHVAEAADFVRGLSDGLCRTSTEAFNQPTSDQFFTAAHKVFAALDVLSLATQVGEDKAATGEDLLRHYQQLLEHIPPLTTTTSTNQQLLTGVKGVAISGNEVLRSAVDLASTQPPETKKEINRLVNGNKHKLANFTPTGKEALRRMDPESKGALANSATEVKEGMDELMNTAKAALVDPMLRAAGRAAVAKQLALSASLQEAAREQPAFEKIVGESAALQSTLSDLLGALQQASANPHHKKYQEDLLDGLKLAIPLMSKQNAAATRAPVQGLEMDTQRKLLTTRKDAQEGMQALMAAIENYENADSSSTNIAEALRNMEANQAQIDGILFTAHAGYLSPAGPTTIEQALESMLVVGEQITVAVNQLERAAITHSGDLGPIATEASIITADLVAATEGVAMILPIKEDQEKLLETLKNLNSDLSDLMSTCKDVRLGNRPKEDAAGGKRDVARDLAQLLNNARGLDTSAADSIVQAIRAEKDNLSGVAREGTEYPVAVKALDMRAKATVESVKNMFNTAQTNPGNTINASKMVLAMAKQLVAAANQASGSAPDDRAYNGILDGTAQLVEDAANVVEAVHSALATGQFEPATEALNQLGVSAAELQRSTMGSMFPEIDEAIARIERHIPLLSDPTVPGKSAKSVLSTSERSCGPLPVVSGSLTGAAAAGTESIGRYATELASNVCALVAAGAAAGHPVTEVNPISPTTFAFITACKEICNSTNKPQEQANATMKAVNLAKNMADAARSNAARLEEYPERQKNFITASKALGAGMPKLIAAIKTGKPQVAAKCAEFLQVAAKKQEAALLGIPADDVDIEPPVPVEPSISRRLKDANDEVAKSAVALLTKSADLAASPSNTVFSTNVLEAQQNFDDAVGKLSQVISELNPAKQAMADTQETLKEMIMKLDLAVVNSEVGVLERTNKTKAQLQAEMIDLLQSLSPDIRTLSAGSDPTELREAAEHIAFQIPLIVGAAQGLSSHANSARLLNQAKALSQNIQKLIGECHRGGPNMPKLSDEVNNQIGDLLGHMKAGDQIMAEIDLIVEKLNGFPQLLGVEVAPSGRSYPEIKDLIAVKTRAMMVAATGLKTCDLSAPGAVGLQSRNLAQTLPEILTLSRDAIVTLQDPTVSRNLKTSTESMVYSITDMIAAAKAILQEDDLVNRAEFTEKWNDFTDSVTTYLTAVKQGSLAENKIDSGSQIVSGAISKLGTAAIFASAGQEFDDIPKTDLSKAQLVEKIVYASPKLSAACQTLVNSGDKTADQLGTDVQQLAQLVSAVCDVAMQISTKEDDVEVQQNVLNSAKAMALSAQQAILYAKNVNAQPDDDVSFTSLNSALNRFPRSLDTFVAVVKGGDASAAAAGMGQLDAIKRNMLALKNSNQASENVTALSIVESARGVSLSITPLVFASCQSDLLKGGQASLSALTQLISNLNGARVPQPLKGELVQSGKAVCDRLAGLVDAAKGSRLDPATHDAIAEASHQLNLALEDVVRVVNKMPDGKGLLLHLKGFGAENTTSSALNEAANIIRLALESLPVRNAAKDPSAGEILSEQDLHDSLIYHARTIAEATYALVEGASEAEKESARDPTKQKYKEDQTWSNGLISASQQTAGCVTLLVRSANDAIRGKLDEETTVAHAKQVAASVKQLVMATGVRAVTPKLQCEISDSAKQVVRGTTDIVGVAQSYGELMAKKSGKGKAMGTFGVSGSLIQKLEQRAQILRLEKQLEEARQNLESINKKEYQ